MTNENIPELLKKAINCWESIREPMVDSGIVDPQGIIPHLVIDAFFPGIGMALALAMATKSRRRLAILACRFRTLRGLRGALYIPAVNIGVSRANAG